MRILIANKYYFMKGGAERYLFNVKALLESHGHTVVPFAVRLARNEPTPYSRYFMDPPAGEDAVQLEEFRLRPAALPRMVLTACYSPQAKARVREAIRREGIDLVYMLNISNYMSPSIIDGAHAEGVPAVHRLSDYNLVCPSAIVNRPGKDRCFDCLPARYWHGIIHRCVRGSLGASIVRSASMFFQELIRVYHRLDAFVCVTPFMRELLAKRGFKRDRLHVVPTPIDASRIEVGTEDDGSFVFFGRISHEKGVDLIPRAAQLTKSKTSRIVVVGDTASPYAKECMAQAAHAAGVPVEFPGPRHGDQLWRLVRRCRATLSPSRWLDNLPNVLLESFACGKPVIGTDVEGINVVVRDGENGLLFQPGNAAEMAAGMAAELDALAADPDRARRMGQAGRRLVEKDHSPGLHYERLMTVFERAIETRRRKR